MPTQRSLHMLKTSLYVLSALLLALGLIAGLSLLASASNVQKVLLPLQLMGNEVLANLITPYLKSLVSSLGVGALLASFVFSLLLFAVGRLVGTIAALEARLVILEARLEPIS